MKQINTLCSSTIHKQHGSVMLVKTIFFHTYIFYLIFDGCVSIRWFLIKQNTRFPPSIPRRYLVGKMTAPGPKTRFLFFTQQTFPPKISSLKGVTFPTKKHGPQIPKLNCHTKWDPENHVINGVTWGPYK